MGKLLDAYGLPMPTAAEREEAAASRQDAWGNWQTGLGLAGDKTKSAAFLPVWRVLDQELTSLFNGSDIARKIVSARPKEMFRRGYDVEAKKLPQRKSAVGKPEADSKPPVSEQEKDDVLEYATEHLDLNNNLLQGKQWGRLYGGSLLIMGIDDGRMPWEPLDEDNIREFYSLSLVDRRYSYVQSQYAAMGASSQYGKAQVYLISNAVAGYGWDAYAAQKVIPKTRQQLLQQGAQVALVHESRVIRFDGNDTDVVTRQNLAGWTWSVLQVVYEAMRQFEGSFDAAAYLLADASQGVFKLQGLIKAISSGQRAALAMRLKMIEEGRSVFHGVALDAGEKDGRPSEDFTRVATPFGGIPDLLDKMMLRLSSAADMPATKLFGRAPAGLNATGDADIRGWYDTIESEAKNELGPVIKRVFKLLCLARKGPLRGRKVKWDVHFHPLWSPTDKEAADTTLANAERDHIYIDDGVVKPEEIAVGLADVYPRLDISAREAALKGGLLFDPYENEPSPEEAALIAGKAEGEPLSPKTPMPLLGTTGTQVSGGNLPVVAAAEAAGHGAAGPATTLPKKLLEAHAGLVKAHQNLTEPTPMTEGAGKGGEPPPKDNAKPGPEPKPGASTPAAPGTTPTQEQARETKAGKEQQGKPERTDAGPSAVPTVQPVAPEAAIVAVWNAAGQLLCVSRPAPSTEMALPGGGVDPGEVPAHAAMRELREELGITVGSLSYRGVLASPEDGRTVHVYQAGRWAGVPRAREVATVVAWLSPEALVAQARVFRDSTEDLLATMLVRPVAPGGAAPGRPQASANATGTPGPTTLTPLARADAAEASARTLFDTRADAAAAWAVFTAMLDDYRVAYRTDGEARLVYEQMAADFPARLLGWVLAGHWRREDVPTAEINSKNRDSWRASHDGNLQSYIDKVKEGVQKPVILVEPPGADLKDIVDGHHRFLAYEALGLPVPAYVTAVHVKHGPWTTLHDSQKNGGSGPSDVGPSWQSHYEAAPKGDAHDPEAERGEGGKWTLASATRATEAAQAASKAAAAGGSHPDAIKLHATAAKAHRYLAGRHTNLKNTAAAAKHEAQAAAHDEAATAHHGQAGTADALDLHMYPPGTILEDMKPSTAFKALRAGRDRAASEKDAAKPYAVHAVKVSGEAYGAAHSHHETAQEAVSEAHRMAGLNPASSFAHGAKGTEKFAIVHGATVKPERAARTETANPGHRPPEPMSATRAYAMGSLASMASGRAQSLEATSGMHGAHKEAGEEHLKAAAAHKEVARDLGRALGRIPEGQDQDRQGLRTAIASAEKASADHTAKAEEHAAAAGSDWDEAKHPRDEQGKFS